MRLCIYHDPEDYPHWLQVWPFKYFFSRLALYLRHKRRPRDEEYMRARCEDRFREYVMVPARDLTPEMVAKSAEIVLLWPDANGYGWSRIENRVFRQKGRGTNVYALNGRRRFFPFHRGLQLTYLLRRLSERFWVAEALMTAIFVLATPIMLAIDHARGRK